MSTPVDHEVVVVGAGFSGIGAAIKLERAGFSDFVVLEEGDGVGGAWHWNTYPGVARRHPLLQLPVLLREAQRLVARVRARARAEALCRALRGQVRRARRTCA